MKRFFLLLVFCFFFMTDETNAQNFFLEEYSSVWERAGSYTTAVAEAMPEHLYDYRAYPDGMSFKEQQLHMVDNISFLSRLISEEKKTFYAKDDINTLTKVEVIEVMEAAFNHVAMLIKITKPEELSQKIMFKQEEISKENIFYLIRNHITHHRGQCVVYLHENNINIPKYVGW